MAEPTRPLRVAVRTLGCKVNRTESDSLVETLLGEGFAVTGEDVANVVVVNTCTVTGEADAKARKAVRQALRAPGEPLVVVTGCLAALDADGLRSLGGRVVVETDKDRLADRVMAHAGSASARGTVSGPGHDPRPGPAPSRTRVAVKVQDGCDRRCAYCIVPDARGVPRSVPAGQVIGRVAALNAADTAEVVLTGVNIGRYADAAGGARDLAALAQAVAATGIARVRISSIEPLDLTDRLLTALKGLPAVMPHLHVPLQSGCDATLAAMRRGYDVAGFADALDRARRALPGLAVTTDVIVGFPGETEADFAESLAAVERLGFTRLHVFRYSRRAGTPAADMPGQVPPAASAERAGVMRALGERLAAAHASSRAGGRARVLVERVGDGLAEGTSEDYLHVRVRLADEDPSPRVGDVLAAEITAAERGCAWARPLEC